MSTLVHLTMFGLLAQLSISSNREHQRSIQRHSRHTASTDPYETSEYRGTHIHESTLMSTTTLSTTPVNVINARVPDYNRVFSNENDNTIESHLPPGTMEEAQANMMLDDTCYWDGYLREEARNNDPYYRFEWLYAQSIAHPDLPLYAWQTKLGANDPRALAIRYAYRQRAELPLSRLHARRAVKVGTSNAAHTYRPPLWNYVKVCFDMFHGIKITEEEFERMLNEKDPLAEEAKAMYNHVCSS